jgi:hypothetical protein
MRQCNVFSRNDSTPARRPNLERPGGASYTNMLRDAPIVEEARQDAIQLVQSDPDLQNPAYERLKRQVLKRYGEALELGDVG